MKYIGPGITGTPKICLVNPKDKRHNNSIITFQG
jgi:hypothetical protein